MANILKGNELKTLCKEEYEKVWGKDVHMVDYCTNKSLLGLKLKDGLIVIEKPQIETHFCFGYGYCGVSTEEERTDAMLERINAETNENYFIKENLKDYDDAIISLKGCLGDENKKVWLRPRYYVPSNLLGYVVLTEWNRRNYLDGTLFRALEDTEIEDLISLIENAREMFLKRLHTYLKKYGLSKLRCWTYLSD